jgi:uroporphyrinogen-III synthase
MNDQGRQQRVVVTRPEGQQQRLMALLVEAGYQPLHQPALVIEPITVDDTMQRTLMELDGYHAVFFASVNAARLALSAMADLWPQWPVGVHWLAVGRATAAELEAWHLPATVPQQGFNTEAVLALPCLQQLVEKQILICRGDSGRELLAQTLQSRGARVDALAFYRRKAASPALIPAETDWVMITSVQGWQAIGGSVPPCCGVVAAGERVADVVRAEHSGDVSVAASAHDEDMLSALVAVATKD